MVLLLLFFPLFFRLFFCLLFLHFILSFFLFFAFFLSNKQGEGKTTEPKNGSQPRREERDAPNNKGAGGAQTPAPSPYPPTREGRRPNNQGGETQQGGGKERGGEVCQPIRGEGATKKERETVQPKRRRETATKKGSGERDHPTKKVKGALPSSPSPNLQEGGGATNQTKGDPSTRGTNQEGVGKTEKGGPKGYLPRRAKKFFFTSEMLRDRNEIEAQKNHILSTRQKEKGEKR